MRLHSMMLSPDPPHSPNLFFDVLETLTWNIKYMKKKICVADTLNLLYRDSPYKWSRRCEGWLRHRLVFPFSVIYSSMSPFPYKSPLPEYEGTIIPQ